MRATDAGVGSKLPLEFPPIAELPVDSSVALSVWGKFDLYFPTVEVRSSEGNAANHMAALVEGWPLLIANNIWWFAALGCLVLAILLLKHYERVKVR